MAKEELIRILRMQIEELEKKIPKNIEVRHIYKGNKPFKDILQAIIEDSLREKKML